MSGLCSRMAGPLRAHSRSRRQMIELSATWVNRLALTSMPLLAATPAETHSAARLEAVYTSGDQGRSALPVEAHTTCDTPACTAAASTLRVPSTLGDTVRRTSTDRKSAPLN